MTLGLQLGSLTFDNGTKNCLLIFILSFRFTLYRQKMGKNNTVMTLDIAV